jgi:hypothetical protein
VSDQSFSPARHGGRDAGGDQQVGGGQQGRHHPRSDRQVGQRRVQQMSQVGAAEQVPHHGRPDRAADRPRHGLATLSSASSGSSWRAACCKTFMKPCRLRC